MVTGMQFWQLEYYKQQEFYPAAHCITSFQMSQFKSY